jgi:hypothetical protein
LLYAAVAISTSAIVTHADEPDLHTPYAAVLAAHVDEEGMVDYAALKENPKALESYLLMIGEVHESDVINWSRNEQIAFYVNAYNAFTLQSIVDHYPIQSNFIASLRFPKNSIRQIDGVWDELEWTLAGNRVTLDGIEHEILRKRFNEPRIHMALVCAAKGCPSLRNKPYTGDALGMQLDAQARRLLSDRKKFRIDRTAGWVALSSIFNWFGEDFVAKYGTRGPKGYVANEKAALGFVMGYMDELVDASYLRDGGYEVEYLDYDWSLNEQ